MLATCTVLEIRLTSVMYDTCTVSGNRSASVVASVASDKSVRLFVSKNSNEGSKSK